MFENIKIEKGVIHKDSKRNYPHKGFPPAKLAEFINSLEIKDSFVIGKEWKARIYIACWKNRPLRVSIQTEDNNMIRVFREPDRGLLD